MSDVYHCSCGSDYSSEDVRDVHEANGHIVQDRRDRSVSADTEPECIHCGATDDGHVTVRVEETADGTHKTVCDVCEPQDNS